MQRREMLLAGCVGDIGVLFKMATRTETIVGPTKVCIEESEAKGSGGRGKDRLSLSPISSCVPSLMNMTEKSAEEEKRRCLTLALPW